MNDYRRATPEDLETIWNADIADHPGDANWLRWKQQFIAANATGDYVTFVTVIDGVPVGQGTLLCTPDCPAIRGRTELSDGSTTVNINALRIRKAHEGQGHISKMVKEMENCARSMGYTTITIGVEAAEARNLGIYLHWGYTQFLFHEIDGGELVLYYSKKL